MTEPNSGPEPARDKPLASRVALVTGGAGGIGAGIAAGLAGAGATVVIGDLVDSADPVDHQQQRLDVTDEESVVAALGAIIEGHGRLDIVVNNAGIMFETDIVDQDRASWDRMLAVNLTGPMLLSRHGAPHLARNGVGSIINIGSIEGDATNPHHAAYAATKAGVHGLTRAIAVDLGPRGVRCNAIAPGWIDTPLNAAYIDGHPDRQAVLDELARLHPVGRIGSPADVADVAVWLAGDGSRFVTGQVITVDGGRTARPSLPAIVSR